VQIIKQTDGWMKRWMVRQIDRQTDGQMERETRRRENMDGQIY